MFLPVRPSAQWEDQSARADHSDAMPWLKPHPLRGPATPSESSNRYPTHLMILWVPPVGYHKCQCLVWIFREVLVDRRVCVVGGSIYSAVLTLLMSDQIKREMWFHVRLHPETQPQTQFSKNQRYHGTLWWAWHGWYVWSESDGLHVGLLLLMCLLFLRNKTFLGLLCCILIRAEKQLRLISRSTLGSLAPPGRFLSDSIIQCNVILP